MTSFIESQNNEWPTVMTNTLLRWIGRAAAHAAAVGVTRAEVEDVARRPERTELDQTQPGRPYLVLRLSRGDITAVVGFENPVRPAVLHVELRPSQRALVGRRVGSNRGRVANAPTTSKGLRGYLINRGCQLKLGGSGHYKVYQGDRYLGTIGSTPRPCSIATDFQRLRRRLDQEDASRSIAI